MLNVIYKDDYISYNTYIDTYVIYLIDKFKKTVLHKAVQNNDLEMVKLLLSTKNIDINILCEKGEEEWKSSSKDESDNFEDIFQNDDDIYEIEKDETSTETSAALIMAVYQNNVDMVKLLLSHTEIDVNIPEEKMITKQTALHIAIYIKNIDIAKLLLPKANINVKATKKASDTTEAALHMYMSYI